MHAQTPCVDGFAGDYPCEGLDLLSVRSLEELGGGANGNDCWGWVDPESDREFVLYGRSNGLSVVEVTDPMNPVFVARVPTATVQSLWRDVKVHDNHAFIVSEAAGHGMRCGLDRGARRGVGSRDLDPRGGVLGLWECPQHCHE